MTRPECYPAAPIVPGLAHDDPELFAQVYGARSTAHNILSTMYQLGVVNVLRFLELHRAGEAMQQYLQGESYSCAAVPVVQEVLVDMAVAMLDLDPDISPERRRRLARRWVTSGGRITFAHPVLDFARYPKLSPHAKDIEAALRFRVAGSPHLTGKLRYYMEKGHISTMVVFDDDHEKGASVHWWTPEDAEPM